ncbi:energy-coupling factor transporter ATPase [Gracilinema caldarium]|uniref:energy-coupling factor transporter ATPase n=1 Tax=Gracilinema caldarium TaxID=215591 RepID=UPI0026E9AC9F|nr:energy-coupling factor transporter ATPase [Gracilinema caldarium]
MNTLSPMDGLAENGKARIVLRDLSYQYAYVPAESAAALQHVSFTVLDGEYVAILGANGSGKSTLIKCINGLCIPEAGQVTIYGDGPLDPARPEDIYPIRQIIGTLLQNPDDQIVGTVVEEDVAFGPENQGLSLEERNRRLNKALQDTGLQRLRSRPPQFLSGGERQRLALAGVLAMETPVLALDEAASMLDEGSRHALMDLLDELWRQGKTILHITHNIEEASRAQRCIVLHQGRLVFNGSPQELFIHPELERWGFRSNSALETVRHLRRRFPDFEPLTLQAEAVAASFAAYLTAQKKPDLAAISQRRAAADGAPERRPAAEFPQGSALAAANGALGRVPTSNQAAVPQMADDTIDHSCAVQCQNVHHTYLAGTAFAAAGLEDITFALPRGCNLALIGPSGSGKSTLLRHLNAILLPTSGQVAVLGQNTLDATIDLRALRRRVVLAVQNPESAQFETYVADEVAYGPRNSGLTGRALVERVRWAMEMVGLPYDKYRDRLVRQLSGGEKRRLALASVLALEGELFLLDEPVAALDGKGQARVAELISQLKQQGKTVISSTHSMEDACTHDLVGVLYEGKLVALGSPEEVFIHRWNPDWKLFQPWTVRFCRALETALEMSGLFPGKTALTASGIDSVLGSLSTAETVCSSTSPAQLINIKPLCQPQKQRKTTGIEFFRNVNLGLFIDIPSILRNLGAGLKLAATIIILFAVILVPTWHFSLVLLGVLLLVGKTLGKVGPKHLLRGLVPAAPYILFMVLVQVLFPWSQDTSQVLWKWGFIVLSVQKMTNVLMLISRLAALMALLALYSAVTPMVESIKAVKGLLAPLGKRGLPIQDVMLIFGIALRFVPLLVEEAERIVIGQLSRGGGYQGRNKLRAGIVLVVPLFLRALERSEILATAMELRLFSVRRTSMLRE